MDTKLSGGALGSQCLVPLVTALPDSQLVHFSIPTCFSVVGELLTQPDGVARELQLQLATAVIPSIINILEGLD